MRAHPALGRLAAVVAVQSLLGQEAARPGPAPAPPPIPAGEEEPGPDAAEAETGWDFSLSILTYLVPDSREYVQPTFTADRGWLHLEARYNYEALDTGSAWIGYNFRAGKKVSFEFTPMLGGVVGETTGVAPGYRASVGWWKLEFYTEGEFVLDTAETAESFYYTWTELSLAPVEWFRLGVVVQRTKLYQTDLDTQRGFLAGFTIQRFNLTTYLFNPDEEPTWVLAAGIDF